MKSALRYDLKLLGHKIQKLLLCDLAVGVLWFSVEASFLFVFQGFLVSMGIFPLEQARLPAWYPMSLSANLFILLGFGAFRAALTAMKSFFSTYTCQAFIGEKRAQLLQGALLRRHDYSTQEIIGSFSETVAQAGNYVVHLSQFIQSFVTTILFFALCAWVAPIETLMGISMLALLIYPIKRFTRNVSTYGQNILENWQAVNKILLNGLKNIFFLRVHHMLNEEVRRGQTAISNYENNFRLYAWASAFVSSIPQLAGMLVICVVAWVSQQWIKTDSLVLISFLYLFIRLAQAASQTNTFWSYMRLTLFGFRDLQNKFLARFETFSEVTEATREIPHTASGVNISVNQLACGYEEQKPLFTDINFDLKHSEMVLIKGPSGVGKSTLLKALVGDLRPLSGEVLYNQTQLLEDYNISPLIGYVGPEPFLIHASVRENLLYGNTKTASDSEIWQVLGHLDMQSVIKTMPRGLDEVLREETQLSAGQKQRLAMARALLRKPRLLILDEATANIDHETEKLILNYLKTIKKDITAFVISHKDTFDSLADNKINLTPTL